MSEVQAVISGDAAAALPAGEAAVARFARALTLDARVSDTMFQAVADFMDERQIVELTMLAGLYRLVACVANGLDVDLDDEPARRLEQLRGERAQKCASQAGVKTEARAGRTISQPDHDSVAACRDIDYLVAIINVQVGAEGNFMRRPCRILPRRRHPG